MTQFATYLHPETCLTSKPVSPDMFVGYAFPHYKTMREKLTVALAEYPVLPLRQAVYDDFLTVHAQDYLDKIALMAVDQPVASPPKLSAECRGYQYCLPGYLYGLGGMFAAIDAMQSGELERAFTFCLGGHHAYSDWGHGYCLLNPLAAAARYAQANGFPNVLMLDWDIHHGDGTQAIFAHDKTVYCISSHSIADLYISKVAGIQPGTTDFAERIGQCNIPLLDDIFEDTFFEEVGIATQFYRAEESIAVFQRALTQLPFEPDIILIFAGCDSHRDDCGARITNWVEADFKTLTRAVVDLANQVSCPILSSQGGGYNLSVNIPTTVAHVEVLASYEI